MQTYLVLGIVFYYLSRFFQPQQQVIVVDSRLVTVTPTPPGYANQTPTPNQVVPGVGMPQPTMTFYPTYTPAPTYTPQVDWLRGSPTPTKNAFEPYQVNFVWSFYNPALVAQMDENPNYAVNCHTDNYIYDPQGVKVIGCKDITASGLPWSEFFFDGVNSYNVRGGVAVPFNPDTCPRILQDIIDSTCAPLYPMGSIMILTEPLEMEGQYLVMDICPACGKYIYSHGVLFLDFLFEGLPSFITFWDSVKIQDVIYP